MTEKSTCKELEARVKELEKASAELVIVQAELGESEEKYRLLFDSANVSIDLRDPETGEMVAFNRVAHECLGYTEGEYQKLSINEIEAVKTSEDVCKHVAIIVAKGSETFETRHKAKNGDIVDFLVSSVAIPINGKKYIQNININITELNLAKEELRKARQELELRVEKRTAELVEKNRQIEQEIEERKEVERKLLKREEELERKNISLEEMNTALRVLLDVRDKDKKELEAKVIINVRELIEPHLKTLKNSRLDVIQKSQIEVIEANLEKIISPFISALPGAHSTFTRKEVQVAGLLKEGKSTKEVAQIMNLSIGAIEFHRKNIRKKLGLTKKKTNLREYLSHMTE